MPGGDRLMSEAMCLRAVPHGAQPVPRNPSLLQPMSQARGTTQIQVRL